MLFNHRSYSLTELLDKGYDHKSAWLRELVLVVVFPNDVDALHSFTDFTVYHNNKQLCLVSEFIEKKLENEEAHYFVHFAHNWQELAEDFQTDLDFDYETFLSDHRPVKYLLEQLEDSCAPEAIAQVKTAYLYHPEQKKMRLVEMVMESEVTQKTVALVCEHLKLELNSALTFYTAEMKNDEQSDFELAVISQSNRRNKRHCRAVDVYGMALSDAVQKCLCGHWSVRSVMSYDSFDMWRIVTDYNLTSSSS
ncbi:hypothetical protein [Vibrio sp. Hal054]|uniref:hypothetical protein n=1 Tax=Vibrio sp. Hal054 TaxID=3035158 RepID=UPI00301E156C